MKGHTRFLTLAAAAAPSLAVPEEGPASAHMRFSFPATQDIFSFWSFSELAGRQLSQTPEGLLLRVGFLRLPYGDSSVLEMAVLGNKICGLQSPSQVWGSPSPYVQCWDTRWEPSFFEAPAPLLAALEWVLP